MNILDVYRKNYLSLLHITTLTIMDGILMELLLNGIIQFIQSGLVKVNGVVEKQRGKKLVGGEVVEFNGNKLIIKR